MIEIIVLFLVLCWIYKQRSINNSSNVYLFNKIAMLQRFSNIQTFPSYVNGYIFKGVDTKGENILFVIKNNSLEISNIEVASIYEKAKKLHYHNIVLVVSSINNINIIKLLKSYNITYWDKRKMLSIINNSMENNNIDYNINNKIDNNINSNINENPTILNTSNTSDDKCTIDQSFNPIMDADSKRTSIFGSLFNKPDRL